MCIRSKAWDTNVKLLWKASLWYLANWQVLHKKSSKGKLLQVDNCFILEGETCPNLECKVCRSIVAEIESKEAHETILLRVEDERGEY